MGSTLMAIKPPIFMGTALAVKDSSYKTVDFKRSAQDLTPLATIGMGIGRAASTMGEEPNQPHFETKNSQDCQKPIACHARKAYQ
ncbi:hypothetical protein Ddye_001270 [Dipteronia dyeriana]|uniref:Uncharacterized protein n=1 Tax=Dipteronia dyeriana TaxID=168575 RepID=A0AAE0CTC2_9ROSI|nr:hypothetical protein Ddye_001270 [Dipteronia dyeriana]